MLSEIFIITSTIPGSDWDEDKICFSLLVDISNGSDLQEAYRTISKSKIKNISLAINVLQSVSIETINDILSFFFISTYYCKCDEFIVSIICNDTGVFFETQNKIIDIGKNQGIPNIRVLNLSENKGNENVEQDSLKGMYFIFKNDESLVKSYVQAIHSGDFHRSRFFFKVGSMDRIDEIIFKVKEADEKMLLQYPLLYNAGIAIQSWRSENVQLRKKCVLLETELENSRIHLQILQSSSQASALQAFYKNEYEILPLWYKRLGHLIKVLMGKRTFKSLFDDNVKKYKD
jgi:hypothetical protein